MTTSLPEVDGRSLWEVVVRMDQKLDTALNKLDDHEDRLRASAAQSEVDRLATKVELLAIEQANLKNAPYVTPKGLATTLATTVTSLLGLIALVNYFVK